MSTRGLRAFVAWLVVALIGTQAIGFHHAIVHADRLDRTTAFARVASNDDGAQWTKGLEHSCAAFDAATLGATATPSLPHVDATCGAPLFTRTVPDANPRRLLLLGYRGRAPPTDFSA